MTGLFRGALVAGAALLIAAGARAQDANFNELAPHFAPATESFDYIKRSVMIPMRDGVKLYTLILIPKGATRAPILLTRTPYGADARIGKTDSAHLAAVIGDGDVADLEMTSGEYIRVFQDVRGKHKSEGDYVMTRPLVGPLNPTKVDHATDTYDTIDWLVKNTPESNGRVGMLGISYDGFTTLMGLVHPHPALKAAVPINPMVDGWMGDDWFHNGAFRQDSLKYAYDQEATRESSAQWWSDHYDDYQSWLDAGSAGAMAKLHGADQAGFTQKLFAHPAYDVFWQGQAMDKILGAQPLTVPVMLVDSLWDQEDIYGAPHVFQALKPLDTAHDKLFMVMGPWFHHQERLDGSAIGDIRFGSDTAQFFRTVILKPFFDRYLKDNPPPGRMVPVLAYETGTDRWLPLPTWPAGCPVPTCRLEQDRLYLQHGGGLGFSAPAAAAPGFTSYVSDPAKPVPFLPRPVHLEGEAGEQAWQGWLVSDQRPAASRTDVLTYESPVLDAPVKIAGEPVVHLNASTSGSDGDFVVKLIDVYPEEMGRQPELGGYQLMVSGDIFRGRYREGFDKPAPIPAGKAEVYSWHLPDANHVFLKGHRMMVQVQSSWFPLYDRNPQSYVENIFFAKPSDYKPATIDVFDAGSDGSFVDLPVVKGK
jgi:putative CocE/NonD family hydrolase